MKFKVGDRVIGVGICDNVNLSDRTGVIKRVREGGSDYTYTVEWDEEDDNFWNCDGVCAFNRGFNCKSTNVKRQKIDNWEEEFKRNTQ